MREKSRQTNVEELRGTRAIRLPHGAGAGKDPFVTGFHDGLEAMMEELSDIHPGGPGAIRVRVGTLEVSGLTKLSLLGQDVLTESRLRQHAPDAEAELARRLEDADVLEIPGAKASSAVIVVGAELVRHRLVPGSEGELVIEAESVRYRSARSTAPADTDLLTRPGSAAPSKDSGSSSVPVVGLTAAVLAALTAVINGGLALFGVLSSAPPAVQIAAGSIAAFSSGVAITLTAVWLYRRWRPCRFARREDVNRKLAVLTQRLDVQEQRLEAADV